MITIYYDNKIYESAGSSSYMSSVVASEKKNTPSHLIQNAETSNEWLSYNITIEQWWRFLFSFIQQEKPLQESTGQSLLFEW